MATIMYGTLYTYTPELYPTECRATANGFCNGSFNVYFLALGRIGGILAPIASGYLLSYSTELPLFISSGILLVCGLVIFLLPIETGGLSHLNLKQTIQEDV